MSHKLEKLYSKVIFFKRLSKSSQFATKYFSLFFPAPPPSFGVFKSKVPKNRKA